MWIASAVVPAADPLASVGTVGGPLTGILIVAGYIAQQYFANRKENREDRAADRTSETGIVETTKEALAAVREQVVALREDAKLDREESAREIAALRQEVGALREENRTLRQQMGIDYGGQATGTEGRGIGAAGRNPDGPGSGGYGRPGRTPEYGRPGQLGTPLGGPGGRGPDPGTGGPGGEATGRRRRHRLDEERRGAGDPEA